MSDLADWLLEQIAADEEVARAATPGPWSVSDDGEIEVTDGADPYGYPHYVTCDSEGLTSSVGLEDADHIARWDPARVLAECAAKRRIVEGIEDATSGPVTEYYIGPMMTTDSVLRLLAQPYRDRAGYRQEWDVQ